LGLGVLMLLAALCMLARRGKWLVVLISVLSVVACLPAPVAVITLLRLRRADVWNSFK
jgi:hypothetical protein